MVIQTWLSAMYVITYNDKFFLSSPKRDVLICLQQNGMSWFVFTKTGCLDLSLPKRDVLIFKDFDFVGWVIKTSWLIYFPSVKFHYVKETHMMLLALVKIFWHLDTKDNEKLHCQDLLRNENTDSDLKARARAALCNWATPTRQTCLSKTFANSPNKQKLSKQVLVMI